MTDEKPANKSADHPGPVNWPKRGLILGLSLLACSAAVRFLLGDRVSPWALLTWWATLVCGTSLAAVFSRKFGTLAAVGCQVAAAGGAVLLTALICCYWDSGLWAMVAYDHKLLLDVLFGFSLLTCSVSAIGSLALKAGTGPPDGQEAGPARHPPAAEPTESATQPLPGTRWWRRIAVAFACLAPLLLALTAGSNVLYGYSGNRSFLFVCPAAAVCLLAGAGCAALAGIIRWHKMKPGRRAARLGFYLYCLVALACFVPLLDRHLPDFGLKHRVARAGGIDRLQAWAVATLEKPLDGSGADEGGWLPISKLPPWVRSLNPQVVRIVKGYPHSQHMMIGWGSSYSDRWIEVGPKTFWGAERGEAARVMSRWREGVYIYMTRSQVRRPGVPAKTEEPPPIAPLQPAFPPGTWVVLVTIDDQELTGRLVRDVGGMVTIEVSSAGWKGEMPFPHAAIKEIRKSRSRVH